MLEQLKGNVRMHVLKMLAVVALGSSNPRASFAAHNLCAWVHIRRLLVWMMVLPMLHDHKSAFAKLELA